MTLNGRYALYCRKDASFGAHHKTLNEGRPTLSGQKCRLMTLVSGGIGSMRIFAEVPRGVGVKRHWGCRKRQFSAFSMAVFSDTLEKNPVLLYAGMQSVVGFSVIPNCMTLNDLEWLFRVKLFSRRFGWLRQCDFEK